MGDVSKPTRAIHKAHVNILKGFDRAKASMADVPLGKEKVDPRTHKKRLKQGLEPGMDTDLTRMLLDMRNTPEQEQQ